jgi:hypothetical protein
MEHKSEDKPEAGLNDKEDRLETETPCGWCGNALGSEDTHCPRCGNAVTGPMAAGGAFQFNAKNNFVVAMMVVAAVFAVVYRSLEAGRLMQTYAAFIGLPLLIGVLTTYLVRPQHGLGKTLKVTTVLLCVLSTLLGEGMICILMAAPIFYAVAAVGYGIVTALDKVVRPRKPGGLVALAFIVSVPFAAAKVTSSPQGIRNPRTMTVQNEVFINAPPAKVWNTLLHGQLVSSEFPLFLRLGFPLPTKLDRGPGGVTRLTFDPGSEPWPGTNVMVSREERDESRHRLTFVIQEDGTKLSRWLTFRKSSFVILPAGARGCRLRQTTTFQQRMQPGLYWNPLQSFAMTQMHAYALTHIKRLAQKPEVESLEVENLKREKPRTGATTATP